MRFDHKFLQSKIARRFFLIFFGCALLPIISLSLLSLTQVTKHIKEQNQNRLRLVTRSYAMSVYERLLLLESTLHVVGSNLEDIMISNNEISTANLHAKFEGRFKGVGILSDMQAKKILYGKLEDMPTPNTEEMQFIITAKTAILIRNPRHTPARVYMARTFGNNLPYSGFILAEIDTTFLWGLGHENSLPPKTEILLLDHNKDVLINSLPVPDEFIKKRFSELFHSGTYQFEWEVENITYTASSWPLFLKANFLIPEITVILSQSKDDLLAPIQNFKKNFWLIVLLTVWIILFFSLIYIRRSLQPLEELKQGTCRVSEGDFNHKVSVSSKDEFGDFARSFNQMSDQLSLQFMRINTIAEIGRLTSTILDIDNLVKIIISRLKGHLDFERGLILLSNEESCRIFFAAGYGYNKEQLKNLKQNSYDLNDPNHQEYFVQASNMRLPIIANDATEIENIFSKETAEITYRMAVRSFLCAPIIFKNEFLGIISFENYRPNIDISDNDLSLLVGIASQIAGNIFNARIFKKLRQKEAALQNSHTQLENRVQDRTDELSKLNRELRIEIVERKRVEEELINARKDAENANKAKSEFLANMSHELRTPLNHIIGFTELILDKKFGDLNEIQKEYLNDVHLSSNHLLLLINDILDLSKIEAGKHNLAPSDVNLSALLENSLVMVREKAIRHSIQLELNLNDIPETIVADERKLKQVVYNLLSNAVKFTPDGGKITVAAQKCDYNESQDLDTISNSNDGIKISVSDTGIGLKPEDLNRIFVPFEQVENSTSRKFQGTGLGLSLTKQLVKLHGGKVWAETKGLGKGATFNFIIPAQ
jgi:signal transduction histidine kinase